MKPSWHSSYEDNNYGDLFYALMRIYQPEKVVELGTKDGYSAYHIARGLQANGKGTLDCYDLFENFKEYYGISSASKADAQQNLAEFKQIISLTLADAIGIDKKYHSVDILHVDLENSDRVLEKIIPAWIDKVRQLIIIEGGSIERDKVDLSTDHIKMPAADWINTFSTKRKLALKKILPDTSSKSGQYVVLGGNSKYKNSNINKWLDDFCKRRKDIEYLIFEPFPSLTLIRKK